MRYGSDLVVDFLRKVGVSHVALNPGASFRALHDSLQEAGGDPEIVVALHEEVAVAIAHGYAKSAGRPMAVFLHDQVGIQHASMALFNAWVDGVPMLVVGGCGPRDATRRRPWIDWIHTANPEAAPIRDVVKFDDEPASVAALPGALERAWEIATTPPMGPVYVAVDVLLQEAEAGDVRIDPAPRPVAPPLTAPAHVATELADALVAARQPLLLVDRGAPGCSAPLLRIAERLAAPVVDLGGRSFPAEHWADRTAAWPGIVSEADLVVAVELRDVTWGLTQVDLRDRSLRRLAAPDARVVSVGLAGLRHRGLMQTEGVAAEVEPIHAEPTTFLMAVGDALEAIPTDAHAFDDRRRAHATAHGAERRAAVERAGARSQESPIAAPHLAATLGKVLREAVGDDGWQLANGLLEGWPRRLWPLRDESSYLGRSGGEGLGYGLPASLGAALAQRELGDAGRLVLDVQADGDLMYTPQALWTAAHHRLPLLIVVHDNRTYGKDEWHQREIAQARGRDGLVPPRGIRLEEPEIDYAALAAAQGVLGVGPVDDPGRLEEVLRDAVGRVVAERVPVLVAVWCSGPRMG